MNREEFTCLKRLLQLLARKSSEGSYLAYIAIFFCVFFILASIFAVLPRKRQRDLIKMRSYAIKSGVSVSLFSERSSFNTKKNSFKQSLSNEKPTNNLKRMLYSKRRKKEPLIGSHLVLSWAAKQTQPETWHWEKKPEFAGSQTFMAWLETALAVLPPDVEIVEERNGLISVIWFEASPGTEKTVVEFLEGCIDFDFS